MTDEVVSHIFEPFFTTKGRRENSGLGLSSVYNIVQKHHGYIDVKTKLGRGTTFLVYLPCVG
jgi:signal transduction histidine kinase